jgi:exodeoxyribonuclease-1
MQFAGQRTSLDLEPIGEPVNILIKLTPDVVPDPDAILVTGITPQQTIQEGISEAEFIKIFRSEVATPGTVSVGYNTVRFDDEFIRYTLYRNFCDPYEWQWKDGCSRWDLLDVVRMTRALRPEGITWPFDSNKKPTNRLELLTKHNGVSHDNAHDALADVEACIEVARLLRSKQQKLFDYLFELRDKRKVATLVQGGNPFVYTSGKYPGEYEKTTVVIALADHPKKQGALVYDLRFDPLPYKDLSPEQLADAWRYKKDSEEPRLPIKLLQFNRCPAVAPLGVLDAASQARLKLDLKLIQTHRDHLASMKGWPERVLQALALLDESAKKSNAGKEVPVDEQLYEGFMNDADKKRMADFCAADPEKLAAMESLFQDKRLQALVPLYKARNYPDRLTPEERTVWEQHVYEALLGGGQSSRLARYFSRLQELANDPGLAEDKRFLLEELQLYGQSVMPEQAIAS